MPVHKSIWNKLHRGLLYAQVATVGYHASKGKITGHLWGPSGIKKAVGIMKRSDKNRSSEYDTWNKFSAKLDNLVQQRQIFTSGTKGENDKELEWIKFVVRSYFDSTTDGQASMVKNRASAGARNANTSFIKRIELLDTESGEWQPVWSDTDG
jgi:hypothetical protein